MALGMRAEAAASGFECGVGADAREHVLQDAPLGSVIEHVAGREKRRAGGTRERIEAGEAAPSSPS